MNETMSPAQTNHLAMELLKDYGLEADQLGAGELINLINLLIVFQWTRHQMNISKDFDLDHEMTLRQDL